MKISPLQIARQLVRLKRILAKRRGAGGQLYVWDRVAEYRGMWQAVADHLGARMHDLDRDVWEIELNGRRTRILNDKLEYDNPVSLIMAGRKPLVYDLLRGGGLRVPEYLAFPLEEYRRGCEFLARYPAGCVVKPADGTSSGQGVTTHVQTPAELRRAAILASLYCKTILIEPMIAGECYRLLVLRGEVIHAVRRRGLRLQGDGTSTIAELLRGAGNVGEQDRDLRFTLAAQNLSLASVPADGHSFLVKSTGNSSAAKVELRTVYDDEVTDEVAPTLKEDAVRAARLLGCDFVGVDFITGDCRLSLEEGGGYINELNTTPGLHHHCGFDETGYSQVALRVIIPLLQ